RRGGTCAAARFRIGPSSVHSFRSRHPQRPVEKRLLARVQGGGSDHGFARGGLSPGGNDGTRQPAGATPWLTPVTGFTLAASLFAATGRSRARGYSGPPASP